MVRFAWNLNRGGTEKSTTYQVLYPVENPPKVNRTVPYHAVEKHHMLSFRGMTSGFTLVSELRLRLSLIQDRDLKRLESYRYLCGMNNSDSVNMLFFGENEAWFHISVRVKTET